ncbi:MAG TPA: sugar-binding domain-containing protein [Anaerolineaceae bacterium]|nr:sugar-binding domain-containing protein [Anaerolineaceae bacterium]
MEIKPTRKNRIRLNGDDKIELLLEVARAYYEQNYDQTRIAQSLGISRSQVSRYLTQARELNLVQVRVVAPNERVSTVEAALQERFGNLKDAIVVPAFNLQPEPLRKTIARAGAQYIDRVVEPGQRICVGSGRTLSEVFNWLHQKRVPNVTIVQAMGNIGHEAMDIDFNRMAHAAAVAFDASITLINAPAILGSGSVRELTGANPSIAAALVQAQHADIYLFGVGSITSDMIFTRGGIFKPQDLEQLRQAGSVGNICARFYDIRGNEIHSSFEDRIVGITLDNLRSEALTISVAGGVDKVLPLIGALHGHLIKVLITDEMTADSILEYEG